MGNKRRNLGDTQPMQPVNPQRAERAERRTQRGRKITGKRMSVNWNTEEQYQEHPHRRTAPDRDHAAGSRKAA